MGTQAGLGRQVVTTLYETDGDECATLPGGVAAKARRPARSTPDRNNWLLP